MILTPGHGNCIIDAVNGMNKAFIGDVINTLTSIINVKATAKVRAKRKLLDKAGENNVRYDLTNLVHSVLSDPDRKCGNYAPESKNAAKK